eukprot:Nk52_evm7s356 gene=Nk52_evmTU7s356
MTGVSFVNLQTYTTVSVAATALAIGYASRRVAGEYHLSNAHMLTQISTVLLADKMCIIVVVNMAYNLLFILGKAIQHFFFGELRSIESQHMYDRLLNFTLFKLIFIAFILEPNFKELFVWQAWFSIIGFMRILIFGSAGVSVVLLLTFECLTLFLDTLQTLIKYAIHLKDLSVDGVWEGRSTYTYYTEFITDTLIHLATLGHYVHIFKLHGVQFTLIDCVLMLNMRSTFNSLRKKIEKFRNYRVATQNLQSNYPDASSEELQAYDDDCAICRERMDNAKVLPCKHLFHSSCLRSWLEQHGTCPTCRRSLLDAQSSSSRMNGSLGGQGGERPEHEHSLFRFNGSMWASWLPSFSVEVVRQPMAFNGATAGEAAVNTDNVPRWMIEHVREIFPNVPERAIAEDLARTNSVEVTSENILDGRVAFVEVEAPPQSSNGTPAPAGESESHMGSSDAGTASARVQSSSFPATTVPAAQHNTSNTNLPSLIAPNSLPSSFPATSTERQSSLQSRKEKMLEMARQNFLKRELMKAESQVKDDVKAAESSGNEAMTSSSAVSSLSEFSNQARSSEVPEALSTTVEMADTTNDPLSRDERRRRALEAAQRRFQMQQSSPESQ